MKVESDIVRLKRGFPNILGRINCGKWKNYLTVWREMYIGHVHEQIIIFKIIVSYDFGYDIFFRLLRSINNINILDRSCVFVEHDHGPKVWYIINEYDYNMWYYLVDDIYHSYIFWSKNISSHQLNNLFFHKCKRIC